MNPEPTTCPECGLAAEIVHRSVLWSTDGPVEHVKTRCVTGHWFVMEEAALRRSQSQARSGRVKLDDDIVALAPLDAVRVSPEVLRSFEAGPSGLEVLAFGARQGDDAEFIHDWWAG